MKVIALTFIINFFIGSVCTAALLLLEQGQEDLQNATSISYPTRMWLISVSFKIPIVFVDLAENHLRTTLQYLNEPLMEALKLMEADGCDDSSAEVVSQLLEYAAIFAHRLAQSGVMCASAAYTASIESFERMVKVLRAKKGFG